MESGDNMLAPTLVRASAGTGKTYQLTARLLRILLQGAPPETILATTFTRKAAGEILERILLTLANAADPDNDEALESLRSQVNLPNLPRKTCLQLLHHVLRNIHRLRICTLDSLFSQLARSFPFELGMPPGWRLTDEMEELWFRERAIEQLIAELDASEMTTLLSMLGKGETRRAIAREIDAVIRAAYSHQRQCDETVWQKLKVARQVDPAELTRALEAFRSVDPPQKTLKKKLNQIVDHLETGDLSGLVDDTLLVNIAAARRSGDEVKFGRSIFPDGLEDAFDVLYSAVRQEMLSLLRRQNEATHAVLQAYDQHITQLKQGARSLGFDDVAIRLATRFGGSDSHVDRETLGHRMDGSIDHVLLDEFQDTSPIQWQVLRPLARWAARSDEGNPSSVHASSRDLASRDALRNSRSFFCVGDTKQAIYGWRGGVAEIFEAVAEQIEGVDEVAQDKSFRSSPVVIEIVNRCFANIDRHPMAATADVRDPTDKSAHEAKALRKFATRFRDHQAARQDLPGHVRIETARRIDEGSSDDKRMACFEDTAAWVARLHRDAGNSRSIGVLTRTNTGVAQMIFLLEREGIEVSQEGGNPLTDSAAVEVVLSALMMAEHPGDGRWKFHLTGTPLADVPGLDSDAIRARIEACGIAETVEYLAGLLAPRCDARETQRLKQLVRLAIASQANRHPRISQFVRMVREKRVERPTIAPVRVMTVHQAKGLEFDAVFLPELDGLLTRGGSGCVADVPEIGQPPAALTRYVNNRAWHYLPRHWQRAFGAQAQGQITEALCLLYVAMTRARQALYVKMIPPRKPSFETKTASSLIYHALKCEDDPSEGETTLLDYGDPHWYHDGV